MRKTSEGVNPFTFEVRKSKPSPVFKISVSAEEIIRRRIRN